MILVLWIIATEALTELVVESVLFSSVRELAEVFGPLPTTLFHCGYCMSVWMAAFSLAVILWCPYGVLAITGIAVHRLSNLVHDLHKKVENSKDEG